MKINRKTSIFFTTIIASALFVSAGATNAHLVSLTASPAIFEVSAPTVLPIGIDGQETVISANNAKVVNNSYGIVKVSDITILPPDGWKIISYDKPAMYVTGANANKLSLIINGCKTTRAHTLGFVSDNFASIVSRGGTLDIIYSANLQTQDSSTDIANLIDVIFTIMWDTVKSTVIYDAVVPLAV